MPFAPLETQFGPFGELRFRDPRLVFRLGNAGLGVVHSASRLNVDPAVDGPAAIRADASCAHVRDRLFFFQRFGFHVPASSCP